MIILIPQLNLQGRSYVTNRLSLNIFKRVLSLKDLTCNNRVKATLPILLIKTRKDENTMYRWVVVFNRLGINAIIFVQKLAKKRDFSFVARLTKKNLRYILIDSKHYETTTTYTTRFS